MNFIGSNSSNCASFTYKSRFCGSGNGGGNGGGGGGRNGGGGGGSGGGGC